MTDKQTIEEMTAAAEGFAFWSSLSLEELAEQQKVSPIVDLDEISALWPVDDDPDKLIDHILADRSGRAGQLRCLGADSRGGSADRNVFGWKDEKGG